MKQTGRKIFHLAGGLGLLSAYYLLGSDRARYFYALLFLVVFGLDIARIVNPALNRFVFARFPGVIRKNEEHTLTGTAPYILGVGLSLYTFALPLATAAVCFLAFGDVTATAVGERYGRTKIRGKSLEGALAFIIAALCSGLLLAALGVHLPFRIMAVGALVAAGVELISLPINDNLLIPVVSGGAMELATRLLG